STQGHGSAARGGRHPAGAVLPAPARAERGRHPARQLRHRGAGGDPVRCAGAGGPGFQRAAQLVREHGPRRLGPPSGAGRSRPRRAGRVDTMGIWQKLSTLLRSNINDAIARAENPEKMLNQVLIDMREQLAKAKQEVAVAIADERKLRAQLDDEQKLAGDWEHRAVLAVREGRDDLAKQALLRQQEHTERAVALEETWRRQYDET